MSNLKVPSGPLADAAFTALVRFVEGGLSAQEAVDGLAMANRAAQSEPKLQLVDRDYVLDNDALDVAEREATAEIHELIGTAPLRQLGLSPDEVIALTCFALQNDMPVLEAAGNMVRLHLRVHGLKANND